MRFCNFYETAEVLGKFLIRTAYAPCAYAGNKGSDKYFASGKANTKIPYYLLDEMRTMLNK